MKKQLFNIIKPSDNLTTVERVYDVFTVCAIVVSLLPLASKTTMSFYITLGAITTITFIIDYFLRFTTADYKLNQRKSSFVKYPFTLLAIADLITILSFILLWNDTFKLLKIIRMVRIVRVFRFFRYSRSLNLLINVLKRQRGPPLIAGVSAITCIFVSALAIFDIEPDISKNLFDALYWSITSLTTIGYGDIYAVSGIGKLVTMIFSILGIAIIALPVGTMTTGCLEEIEKEGTESEQYSNIKNAEFRLRVQRSRM